jgi:hypothetical protein
MYYNDGLFKRHCERSEAIYRLLAEIASTKKSRNDVTNKILFRVTQFQYLFNIIEAITLRR